MNKTELSEAITKSVEIQLNRLNFSNLFKQNTNPTRCVNVFFDEHSSEISKILENINSTSGNKASYIDYITDTIIVNIVHQYNRDMHSGVIKTTPLMDLPQTDERSRGISDISYHGYSPGQGLQNCLKNSFMKEVYEQEEW